MEQCQYHNCTREPEPGRKMCRPHLDAAATRAAKSYERRKRRMKRNQGAANGKRKVRG